MREKHYSQVLSLCITPETFGVIKTLAGEKHISVSELVRKFIESGVELDVLNRTENVAAEAVETPA